MAQELQHLIVNYGRNKYVDTPIKYIEDTMASFYKLFRSQHPGVKMSINVFSDCCPPNVKLLMVSVSP